MAFKMNRDIQFTNEKYIVDKSAIQGQGAIATNDIKKGELIGTAIDDEEGVEQKNHVLHDTRTILGRSLNHQNSENAIQKSENNSLNVYAKSEIKKGDEITINYKNAPSYVDKRGVEDYKEI